MSLIRGSSVSIAISGALSSSPTTVLEGVLVDNKYDSTHTNIEKRFIAVKTGGLMDQENFKVGDVSYGILMVRRSRFKYLVKNSTVDHNTNKPIVDEYGDKYAEHDPIDLKDLNHAITDLPDSSADASQSSSSSTNTNNVAPAVTSTDPAVLLLLQEFKQMKQDQMDLMAQLAENAAEMPPLAVFTEGDDLKKWKDDAIRWEKECQKQKIRSGRMITTFLTKIKGTCNDTVKKSDKYNIDTLTTIQPILAVLEYKVYGTQDEQFFNVMERWDRYSWDDLPEIISRKKREERRDKGLSDEPTMLDHKQEVKDIRKEVEGTLTKNSNLVPSSSTNTSLGSGWTGFSGAAGGNSTGVSISGGSTTNTNSTSRPPTIVNFGDRYWGYYYLKTLKIEDEEEMRRIRLTLQGNFSLDNVASVMSHTFAKIKSGTTKSDGSLPLSAARVRDEEDEVRKLKANVQSLTDKLNHITSNNSNGGGNNQFRKGNKPMCKFGFNCTRKGKGCTYPHPDKDSNKVQDNGGKGGK